jgi:hypothetical protein
MPDLIRHPAPFWISAFAEMTTVGYLAAGVILRLQAEMPCARTDQVREIFGIGSWDAAVRLWWRTRKGSTDTVKIKKENIEYRTRNLQ